MKSKLQKTLAESSTTNMALEDRARALRAEMENSWIPTAKQQSDQFADTEARMQDALRSAEEAQQLIKEETERQILFNQYQERKGYVQGPPALGDSEGEEAGIKLPDFKTSAQVSTEGPGEKSPDALRSTVEINKSEQ